MMVWNPGRDHPMNHRTLAAGVSGVVLAILVAGCAGPGTGSLASRPAAADLVRASGLAGTWHGEFGWVGASIYTDEALIALRIEDDGTFTANVTRNGVTNNLAKATTWSGTVLTDGNRVTLRNSNGPWGWVTLVRSGNGNVLYGVAHDPTTGANVRLKFERDGSRT
jgi:hypothetical protein